MNGNVSGKICLVWDMETGDPDDCITLLFLLGHPEVDLKAVTITPGSRWQVGIVKWALDLFNKEIPVGSFDITHRKKAVSDWHYSTWGDIPPSDDAEPASSLLHRVCHEKTTILTGAPLRNLAGAIVLGEQTGKVFRAERLIAQGGFAGEGVVPAYKQMRKFKGRTTCPTYNLMDYRSARTAMNCPGINMKRFVSKNVCHRVVYDVGVQGSLASAKGKSLSLDMIYNALGEYPVRKNGKKLHDLFAACCALDETIGEWAEVKLYQDRKGWGANLSPGSGIWIIVDYDRDKFIRVLTAV